MQSDRTSKTRAQRKAFFRLALCLASFAVASALAQDRPAAAIPAARDRSKPDAALPLALRSAEALVDRRQYDEAESLLKTLVAQEPHSAAALYLLALVQQRANRPADSLRTYTAAAALRTPTAEELRLVALDYVLLNDYPDASHWLERSTRSDPKNAEALYDLARVRMHDGRFGEAATLLRQSLQLRPGSSKAWDNLGVSQEAQNDPDGAEVSYQHAVAASDQAREPNAQAFLDYGTLLNTRNGSDKAVPILQRAIVFAPKNAKAHAELGRALLGVGDTHAALQSMQKAVALDDKDSRLHYQLGRIYRSLGRVDEANTEFARSAALYGTKSAE